MNLTIPNDFRVDCVPICRSCLYDATRDIDDQSFNAVTQLDDFIQRRPVTNEKRCAWRALVYIVFGYAGGGRGEGGRGIARFARSWGLISSGYISKTVRDNPIIMVHFFD